MKLIGAGTILLLVMASVILVPELHRDGSATNLPVSPVSPSEGPVSLPLVSGQPATLLHESGAAMIIPPMKLSGSATASITPLTPLGAAPGVGQVFDFSVVDAHGNEVELQDPVTLRLPFESSRQRDVSNVFVMHWNEEKEEWEPVARGMLDEAGNVISANVRHLSKYSWLNAEIDATCSVSPSGEEAMVEVGDYVTIKSTVTSRTRLINIKVHLRPDFFETTRGLNSDNIDGYDRLKSETTTLSNGETADLTYSLKVHRPGDWGFGCRFYWETALGPVELEPEAVRLFQSVKVTGLNTFSGNSATKLTKCGTAQSPLVGESVKLVATGYWGSGDVVNHISARVYVFHEADVVERFYGKRRVPYVTTSIPTASRTLSFDSPGLYTVDCEYYGHIAAPRDPFASDTDKILTAFFMAFLPQSAPSAIGGIKAFFGGMTTTFKVVASRWSGRGLVIEPSSQLPKEGGDVTVKVYTETATGTTALAPTISIANVATILATSCGATERSGYTSHCWSAEFRSQNTIPPNTTQTAKSYPVTITSPQISEPGPTGSIGVGPIPPPPPPSTDRGALIAFYNSTNGQIWRSTRQDDEPWLTGDSRSVINDWYGVETNENNRVESLVMDYSDDWIVGTIPSELGNLTQMTDLILYNHQQRYRPPGSRRTLTGLHGPIPPELGNLAALKDMFLNDNRLSGEIPAALGNLSNLWSLDLSGNLLSGKIPPALGNLSNLVSLELDNNNLEGEIPAELGRLSDLLDLDLSNNGLEGEIPAELGNLTNLEDIDLSGNNLTGCRPAGLRSADWESSLGLQFCDTALSGLTITPGRLQEPFDANQSSFAATVFDSRITIQPTSAEGATFEIRDTRRRPVPDADAALAGLQLDLSSDETTVRLRVTSRNGEEYMDYTIELTLKSATPTVPALSAVDPQGSSLYVSWSAPDERGSSEISSYNLRHIRSDATDKTDTNWTVVEDVWQVGYGSLSYLVDTLDPATSYDAQVQAVNDAGSSPWSASATGTTGTPSAGGCFSGGAVADAANNPGLVADCEVLLAARDTLAGTASLDWSASTSIGDWGGVTVSGTPQRVTGLDLANRQLTGSIPVALGSMTELQSLLLSNNQLTGEIPGELGNLANLTSLSLHNNQLTGEIPGELGNLANLTSLSLHNNQLTGEIPGELGNLANLTSLSLHNNQLTGEIPGELGNLANLTSLSLHNNQLTGEIPGELGNLANLTELYLSYNGLTGAIPEELGSLTNLTRLYLSGNDLTGEIPEELGNLANLTSLSLHNNQLTGEIPGELGRLANLTELYLSGNDLTGEIPEELGNLTNLTLLYLYNNQLTGCIPAGLRDVENNDLDQTGLPDCGGMTGPGAPQNLTATANGQTQIDLSWSAPSGVGGSPITGYQIEVSTDRTAWSDLVANTGSTATNYSHTGLTAGTTRHYRVSAINSAGTGPASNVAVGTTAPPSTWSAVRSFSPASVDPGGQVVVTITATGYGGFGQVVETLPPGFSYVSTSLLDESVTVNGGEVSFVLLGETDFTYTVAASSAAGSYSFSGVLTNSGGEEVPVGGALSLTVGGLPSVDVSHAAGSAAALVRLNSPISLMATFSEPVSGFILGDISIGNGTGGNLAGSGAVYTFEVTPDAIGEVTVDIAAGVAVNAGGDGNTAAPQFSLGIPYNDDGDGAISKSEVITAIRDYFAAVAGVGGITKADVIKLIRIYFATPPPPAEGQTNPDLVVESASVSDNNLETGESFTLRATVRNRGNGESSGTTLRYYRSPDSTITIGDTGVGTDPVGALGPSGAEAKSTSLTAPEDAGAYYYGACVDWVTDESDTNNNCSSGVQVTVTEALQNSPDLVVSVSIGDTELEPGETFAVTSWVSNSGLATSPATTLRIYRSTDSSISAGDTVIGVGNVRSLAPSETQGYDLRNQIAPSVAGTYYYGSCVESVSGESDTTNNCSSGVRVTVEQTRVKASFQKFYVIDVDLDEYGDHDRECKLQLGGEYRLADWNDLKEYYAAGGSIPELISGLNWKDENTTDVGMKYLKVSKDGNERWGGSRRHYFVARHDHVRPGYFLVHDHIDNYHLSLGSWYWRGGEALCMPSAGDAATDRAALVALYNATGGANWGNNGNWLSNAPMGEWHGVTTDSDGRVTHLDLRTNQLTGEIPAELGDLTNLTELQLRSNQLTGCIPEGLRNIRRNDFGQLGLPFCGS